MAYTALGSFLLVLIHGAACQDIGSFWHITDVHYDPTVYTTQESCRPKLVPVNVGVYGDYKCDSPWSLINSSVQAMKQIEPNPDFILWTGDNTPHLRDYSTGTEQKIIDVVTKVTDLLMAVFPQTTFYSTLGNHDYHPDNQFPGKSNNIYNAIADKWGPWLNTTEADSLFRKGAYYSLLIKPGFRIIVLNTNLYYRSNKVSENDPDPGKQFKYLEDTLEAARKNKEKVYITAHIAPGLYDRGQDGPFRNDMNTKYNNLMLKYDDIILAMIYGHKHLDGFRIYYKNGQPVNAFFLTPSVTPWVSESMYDQAHNPAIRLFKYRRDTMELLDIWQYYLNLPDANQAKIANWVLEYKMTEAYGIDNISAENMDKVLKSFEEPGSATFKKYVDFNTVSAKDKTVQKCNADCKHLVLCVIKNAQYEDFMKCKSNKPPVFQVAFY